MGGSGVPVATEEDLRAFRQIRRHQDQAGRDRRQLAGLQKLLVRISDMLGRPWRLKWTVKQSIQTAYRGIQKSGAAASAHGGVGIATQFLRVLSESARTGVSAKEFYLNRLYLTERWRGRSRLILRDQIIGAQRCLSERDRAPDFDILQNKDLFAKRCGELGLPAARPVAEFREGRPIGEVRLPPQDLFSKPVDRFSGDGAEVWRYDEGSYVNARTEERLSPDTLISRLAELSRLRPIIVQERLRNHAGLLPLTNGALATLRLATCRSPAGDIDLMPPVIRMPTGKSVVDSFAQQGLAAPIDLVTGTICGPAVKRDDRLGLISFERHPDSGHRFEGTAIPLWAEAIELARMAHQQYATVHFVGWDVAVLQTGPVLLEANALFNPELTALPHGLTFADTQFVPYYNFHWQNGAPKETA